MLANELYHELTREGFKVFFSRITLEDKLGTAYEPYIFAALNSAKVMVVLGTKPEYFNAVWVKNEWSRYLALIRSGARKTLIPAYRDMDPYDLPEEFSHLQAQDMNKLGFLPDLIRGVKKLLEAEKPKISPTPAQLASASPTAPPTDALMRRAVLFLEDGDWRSAEKYAEKVLDFEPENAEAYLVKLLSDARLKSEDLLSGVHAQILPPPEDVRQTIQSEHNPPEEAGRMIRLVKYPLDRKVSMIKWYRESTGCGLAEAKQTIEDRLPLTFFANEACIGFLNEIGATYMPLEIAHWDQPCVFIHGIKDNPNFKKFLRFAPKARVAEIQAKLELAKERSLASAYQAACDDFARATSSAEFASAAKQFSAIKGYQNADEKQKRSLALADDARKREEKAKEAEQKAARARKAAETRAAHAPQWNRETKENILALLRQDDGIYSAREIRDRLKDEHLTAFCVQSNCMELIHAGELETIHDGSRTRYALRGQEERRLQTERNREEQRQQVIQKQQEDEVRKQRLLGERQALDQERKTLKGLFAGRRRKEIDNRIAEIDRILAEK